LDSNKKFLFDLNNFDTAEVEEEEVVEEIIKEDLPPPPPTFSEDELESSKIIAHEKGRLEGVKEERNKREESVKEILQEISKNFSSLFSAEQIREKKYEEESLNLGLALIDALAPTLEKNLGVDTLKTVITDTLQHQSKKAEIRIDVAPDNVSEISHAIESIWPEKEDMPKYKVLGNNDLNDGGCEITWKDGGMIRDPAKTADEIRKKIEALLGNQQKKKKTEEKNNSKLTSTENNAINDSGDAPIRPTGDDIPADNPPPVNQQADINGEDNE